MTDTPEPDAVPPPLLERGTDGRPSRDDVVRALGFDPAAVKAVIVTESSVVAIAVDYPEPTVKPDQEER